MTYIICDLKGKIYSRSNNLQSAECITKVQSVFFDVFLVYFKKVDYNRFVRNRG
jgi:hypothetical protein